MVHFHQALIALGFHFLPLCVAAPAVENVQLEPSLTVERRQLGLQGLVGPIVTSVLSGLVADATDGAAIVSAIAQAVGSTVGGQIPPPPANVPDAVASLSSIFAAAPTEIVSNVLQLIPAGFPAGDIDGLTAGALDPRNSQVNVNAAPPDVIFPRKSPQDAPYSMTETQLRQVIYIPPTFTFGLKPPVILVPGSGNTGFQTYIGNYIPLLTGVSYADPVWLNIPGQLLNDAQGNAEFVAYAVNYISSITGNKNNVNVLTWSQGSIGAQWAFKYWPSTRPVTQNLIANSPDYAGTVLAFLLAPELPQVPNPPAVLQQRTNSNFIMTLRNNGGDSGIVPTTNIYSATDEIVQPQSPLTGASGYLLDRCNVGVSNVLIQDTCGGRGVGGTFYTHEGVLYSSLGVNLAINALQNGRPARVADLNLDTVCGQYLGPGLDITNLLISEEAIIIAALSIIVYQPKVLNEPVIRAYASSVVPVCNTSSTSSMTSSSTSMSGTSSASSISSIVTTTTTATAASTSSSTLSASSVSLTTPSTSSTNSAGISITTTTVSATTTATTVSTSVSISTSSVCAFNCLATSSTRSSSASGGPLLSTSIVTAQISPSVTTSTTSISITTTTVSATTTATTVSISVSISTSSVCASNCLATSSTRSSSASSSPLSSTSVVATQTLTTVTTSTRTRKPRPTTTGASFTKTLTASAPGYTAGPGDDSWPEENGTQTAPPTTWPTDGINGPWDARPSYGDFGSDCRGECAVPTKTSGGSCHKRKRRSRVEAVVV